MRALVLPASLRLPLAAALSMLLSLSFLTGPAEAKKRAKKTLPTISSIAPPKVAAGDVLIIKGKNFSPDKTRNTVLLRNAAGGKFVFAQALAATKSRVTVKLPAGLNAELDVVNGAQQPTRFQVRVVSGRASSFSAVSKSPVILPPSVALAKSDCDKDGTLDTIDADDDNDGLSDSFEIQYKLNSCEVDTDGDGVWDYFEVMSAFDLNTLDLPYPGKAPWPNPLDPTDANFDFDGDGLRLSQEQKFWQAAGRPLTLNYSDGDQYTGGPVLAPSPDYYGLDIDKAEKAAGPDSIRTGIGYLSDEEKDFDGDGLGNFQEMNFRMTQAYWKAMSAELGELPYPLRPFSDLDATNPDSDGDGRLDGFDDQDNDGWSNMSEQYRQGTYATNHHAFMVQPFNPCLPDWDSRSCSKYIIAGEPPWAPFDIEGGLPAAPIGWNPSLEEPTPASPDPGYVPDPRWDPDPTHGPVTP